MENKKKIIISVVLIVILIIIFVIYTVNNKDEEELNLNYFVLEEEENFIENNNQMNENQQNIDAIDEKVEEIAIHIVGEVKNEGIIYLKKGARIIDAINEAGGETKQADLSQINLAYVLEDGLKIYIPNKKEKITEYIIESNGNNVIQKENKTSNTEKGDSDKVNINTATQEELDSLPGIGPSTAQKIIDYREENGLFKKIEDIQNVKGIGESKYSDVKDKITV